MGEDLGEVGDKDDLNLDMVGSMYEIGVGGKEDGDEDGDGDDESEEEEVDVGGEVLNVNLHEIEKSEILHFLLVLGP